jgi:hypothetical protein
MLKNLLSITVTSSSFNDINPNPVICYYGYKEVVSYIDFSNINPTIYIIHLIMKK